MVSMEGGEEFTNTGALSRLQGHMNRQILYEIYGCHFRALSAQVMVRRADYRAGGQKDLDGPCHNGLSS
jgi:hypothetical protein